MAEIKVEAERDPEMSLASDAVAMGAGDYPSLTGKPSLNGVTLEGDLTSEDVGITARALGVTAESLGLTPEEVARSVTPESLGMATAGAAKVIALVNGG